MIVTVLEPIEDKTRLADLFNRYMNLNHSFEMVAFPMYYSMKELSRDQMDPDKWKTLQRCQEATYEYIVLNNSLHSYYSHVIKAIKIIERYQRDFNSNWEYFAVTNRLENIKKWGGESEDYDEEDNIIETRDKQLLKYHTIHSELSHQFANNESRGEYIGSSTPEDFERFSRIAANNTEFSIFKVFSQAFGEELKLYKEVDGQMVPQSTGDRIESEINQDINNEIVVSLFNVVLLEGIEAFKELKAIDPFSDSPDAYNTILVRLKRMLNVDYIKQQI